MSASDRDLITRFLEMLAAEQGVASNTLSAYKSDLLAASQLLDGKLNDAGADNLAELASNWRDLANSSVAVDMTTADGKENVKEKDIVGVVKTVYFSRGQDSNSFPDLVVLLLGQYQITSVGSSIKFARS